MCGVRIRDAQLVGEKVGAVIGSSTPDRYTGKQVKSLKRGHVAAPGIGVGGKASGVERGLATHMGSRVGLYSGTVLLLDTAGETENSSARCRSYGFKMQPVGAPTRTLWGTEAPSPSSSDGGRLATTYIAASQSSRGTRLNNQ